MGGKTLQVRPWKTLPSSLRHSTLPACGLAWPTSSPTPQSMFCPESRPWSPSHGVLPRQSPTVCGVTQTHNPVPRGSKPGAWAGT